MELKLEDRILFSLALARLFVENSEIFFENTSKNSNFKRLGKEKSYPLLFTQAVKFSIKNAIKSLDTLIDKFFKVHLEEDKNLTYEYSDRVTSVEKTIEMAFKISIAINQLEGSEIKNKMFNDELQLLLKKHNIYV